MRDCNDTDLYKQSVLSRHFKLKTHVSHREAVLRFPCATRHYVARNTETREKILGRYNSL